MSLPVRFRPWPAALLFTFLLTGLVQADLVNRSEADRVAENWLALLEASDKSTRFAVVHTNEISVDSRTLGWAYSLEPSGYIVVPSLRQLPPVKMYSTVSSIDLSADDGPGALIRTVLADRFDRFQRQYGSLAATPDDARFASAEREWQRLAAQPAAFKSGSVQRLAKARTESGPLLTSLWAQGAPYNDWCPTGDGGQCVVGCVATAFAQIMAYHEWPPAGEGEFSYNWDGDQSCGGTTPGQTLTAYFSDPYDWDNIVDNCYFGCEPDTVAAIAELCYEVGVACQMNYGRCASGAWPYRMVDMMPQHFRYRDEISEVFRSDYTQQDWFDLIREQIDLGLPTQYTIYSHAIACDGYRIDGELLQYHMNYGWSDGHNAWYVLDELYCPWEGCDPMIEHMIIDMKPDRDLVIDADTTWGWAPLSVQFEGFSELDVWEWVWQFGDGDSSMQQSPSHTYDQPGLYDLVVYINTDQGSRFEERPGYIAVLADTMKADSVQAAAGDTLEVSITARTTLPLEHIEIPVAYFGDVSLELVDWSTDGCRSDVFQFVQQSHYDPMNFRSTFRLFNSDGGSPMPAGEGPVLRLSFSLSDTPLGGETTEIAIDGYADKLPYFEADRCSFVVPTVAGHVAFGTCCQGIRGDVNNDGSEGTDVADLITLVQYMFNMGPPIACPAEADVDANGTLQVSDLVYLVTYMFSGGALPEPCP